jgi:hypothetical protein
MKRRPDATEPVGKRRKRRRLQDQTDQQPDQQPGPSRTGQEAGPSRTGQVPGSAPQGNDQEQDLVRRWVPVAFGSVSAPDRQKREELTPAQRKEKRLRNDARRDFYKSRPRKEGETDQEYQAELEKYLARWEADRREREELTPA